MTCWPMDTRRKDGYATFGDRSTLGELYTHRICYLLTRGSIPENHEVDHLCRVRNCVNPLHLRACLLVENRPGPGFKTACWRGHPLSGDNLYVNPNTGVRNCRECVRAANRAWHHANKDHANARRAERRRIVGS